MLLFFFLTILPAEVFSFKGTVVDKNNTIKRYIRVNIAGKNINITTFTDQNGIFDVDITRGNYTITIRERARTMVFSVTVSSNKQNKVFRLKW